MKGPVRRPDFLWSGLLLASLALSAAAADRSRRIEYSDLPEALQRDLGGHGISAPAFGAFLDRVQADTDRRVAEGEKDHLIHYALQSSRFSGRAPIEPAVSARRFVERLSDEERKRLLEDPSYVPRVGWPPAELHARRGQFPRR